MAIEVNNRPNVKISKPVNTPGGGITDHGQLTGLADDDHPQYLNQGRGDARYALTVHAHDQYLVPAEVIAGTNVNVDSTTTPGSVIINAEGIVTGGMAQGRWRWLPAPQTGSLSSGRCGVDNDQVNSATTFYIHKNSEDGVDWSYYLSQLDVGWYVYGQALADSTSWAYFAVTGPSSLTGDTWEVPITVDGGSPQGTEPGNNANVAIGFQSPRIVDHAALSGLNNDDHPQYLTEARGDARYDATGTADLALNAHESLADPHTQYLLADGSRNLTGNLTVTGVLTVDDALGIVAQQITLAQEADDPAEVPTKGYVDTELATKADTTYVDSRIWKGTQAQYDALGTYDPDILYVVTG